jgi:predicted transcriptional regulator with HTH domain
MLVSSLIYADSPNGNNRRISLTGIDMVPVAVDNVFIYPFLDLNRLEKALRRTISDWPIVVGRLHIINNEDYFIELSDNGIPLTYIENDKIEEWPILPVVVEDESKLKPFIDSVPNEPNENESLVRLKLTHLIRSNEYILGVSFYHLIGDGDSLIHFLNDLSCFYQDIQPILPRPIFERHLWLNDNIIDSSLLPMMKQLVDARQRDQIIGDIIHEQEITDPIQISFSSEQLIKLQNLASQSDEHITIQDALNAYLIVKLNKHVFITENEHIQRINTIVNYRGISDSLAPHGQVDNSIMFMLSDDFPNPLCLSSIAQTIRRSINKSRDEDFLNRWLITLNTLMLNIHKQGQTWNYVFYPNEIWTNSNWKYDWASQVDFGMKDQSRFHTTGSSYLKFRIFRLNPFKDIHGNWIRDQNGAEVSFRIQKGKIKDNFIIAWKNDIEENFQNI